MKDKLVRISGGLAVMLSVFLLLLTVKQFTNKDTVSTKIVGAPVQTTEEKTDADLSENVLRGTFNINTPGNVVRSYDETGRIVYYYKAIVSQKLKNEKINPVLKLEVNSDGKIAWKETPWSWIDYSQGTLFFYFKTVENGTETMADNYTGKYQLIFQ